MDFDLDSTDKIVSICAAGLGVMAFFIKKIILPKVKKLTDHFSKTKEMMGKIGYIYAELTPNGGGSIKDHISKMKTDLSEVHDLSIANNLKTMLLFAVAPDALFECNLKGETIWVNDSLENIFECDKIDLLGDGWISFIHADDVSRVWKAWAESVETLHPYRIRYRILTGDGTKIKYIEASASVLRSSSKKPLSFFGKVVEVSGPI